MTFMNKRKFGKGEGGRSSGIEKPMVRLVSSKEHERIEKIRAAFQPEKKPKVSLPKFSWDKKDDE